MFTSDLIYWLSVTLACLLGAMSPGPSIAVVISHAISGNRWAGLFCAWGHGLAVAGYATISAFGLIIVFEQSLLIFNFVQLAGIVVLTYLGIRLISAKAPLIASSARVSPISHWRAARDGFLVAFVNPKVMLFFAALFSQFLHQDMTSLEKIGLVLVASSVDALWYTIIAVLIVKTTILSKLQRHAGVFNKLFGSLLIFYCVYFSQIIINKLN
jgi:threonine/homoserine/homoserine lactone efflux protein